MTVASTLDPLGIRRRLGRAEWGIPSPYGPDGWVFPARARDGLVIVTAADHDGAEWVHASISHPGRMPTYDELTALHAAVYADGWAYQVFAPAEHHVNIHSFALHLWGRHDGAAALPNFGEHGTI